MVFPTAIREKSQRGVDLSYDALVMSASSGKIRQPCTFSLSDPVSCEQFFYRSAFLRGKLIKIEAYGYEEDAGCCNASLINSHARHNSNNGVYYMKSNVDSVKNTTKQGTYQYPRTPSRV